MSKQRNSTAAPRRDQEAGTWWFVVDLPPGPDGKRRQAKRRGFPTKKAATEDMDRLRVKARDGNYVAPKRQTVGAFLTDEWLPSLRVKLEASTLESYERMVRCHVVDRIGGVMLQQLSGAHLNHLYGDLLANGRRDGKGGLSARSVRYLHTILHAAFDDACRWERVAVNVAERADPPSASAARPPEMGRVDSGQPRGFPRRHRRRPLPAAVPVPRHSASPRRHPVVGLRWSDVDLDAARASIRQQVTAVEDRVVFSSRTKTGKPRLIELDAVTVAALRSWRARQAEERLAMGAGWQEHGLVFTHPDGRPYHPKRFSREFDRRIARHGLPRIRLHDLRHTWATLALEAGIDVKVVAERLGHSSVATTWATYQHVTRPMASDAAEKVAGLIFGGQGR